MIYENKSKNFFFSVFQRQKYYLLLEKKSSRQINYTPHSLVVTQLEMCRYLTAVASKGQVKVKVK